MSSTDDRRPQRDKERTRAAILAAAERTVTAQGSGFTLAEVAAEAGVTKSGLLHHFPSRSELIVALGEQVVARTWDEINVLVAEGDDAPGAFARAYVRASTGDSAYLTSVFSSTGLVTSLGESLAETSLDALFDADAKRLNAAFEADGLPMARALAVRYAADGVLSSIGSPYLTDQQLVLVRDELLVLTRV